jgi:hypothetical protein
MCYLILHLLAHVNGSYNENVDMWKDRGFAIWAKARWLERCGINLCANIN